MGFKEDWPKIDNTEGWLFKDEARMLYRLASRAKGPIVEIGSWKGRSSVCLGLGAMSKPNIVSIYCIDTFKGSKEHKVGGKDVNTYKEFKKNTKQHLLFGTILIPIISDSKEASILNGINDIGLLFIDGSHEYEDVSFDFKEWGSRVIKGGWICVHDVTWPGVYRTLRENIDPSKHICTHPINTMAVIKVIK